MKLFKILFPFYRLYTSPKLTKKQEEELDNSCFNGDYMCGGEEYAYQEYYIRTGRNLMKDTLIGGCLLAITISIIIILII